jgi:hypothetical protein
MLHSWIEINVYRNKVTHLEKERTDVSSILSNTHTVQLYLQIFWSGDLFFLFFLYSSNFISFYWKKSIVKNLQCWPILYVLYKNRGFSPYDFQFQQCNLRIFSKSNEEGSRRRKKEKFNNWIRFSWKKLLIWFTLFCSFLFCSIAPAETELGIFPFIYKSFM